jgi:hypothetical protein
MSDHKILFTGDFWHADFRGIISSIDVPLTLVPLEKIESVSESKFELVVVAQSRRDQIGCEDIEKLQSMFEQTPVVGLLGTWCEGETRSGNPWQGTTRVFWHQWEGRYDSFVQQMEQAGVSGWHAPRTTTIADRIAAEKPNFLSRDDPQHIGISAWSNSQYEMLADAMRYHGWIPHWVERTMWDGQSSNLVSTICIDADSWSYELSQRINWLNSEFPNKPKVLLLNFPRANELEEIKAAGVTEVVSKPYELADLKRAVIGKRSSSVSETS